MKSEKHKKRELLNEETEEDIKEDFEEGEKDPDVYTKEGAEYLNDEDDSLEDDEAGFMEGEVKASEDEEADETESLGTCDHCGKLLDDSFVEGEVEGELHEFCCDFCASEFKKIIENEDIADHTDELRKESFSENKKIKKKK